MPLSNYNLDLSAVAFRDALAPRYDRPMVKMPSYCDGCGKSFNIQHALVEEAWLSGVIMKFVIL